MLYGYRCVQNSESLVLLWLDTDCIFHDLIYAVVGEARKTESCSPSVRSQNVILSFSAWKDLYRLCVQYCVIRNIDRLQMLDMTSLARTLCSRLWL